MQHVRAVCSVTDPFCPASKNSKWPDGTSGNTMTEQFRGNLTVSSLAAGNNLVFFTPQLVYGILAGASSSGSVVTMATTSTIYKTGSMLQTHGSFYRIVSFGVIVRGVASATNAAGLVTFGTTSATPALGGAYTLGTELYDEVAVKAIQPGLEHSWISVPKGSAARQFGSYNTANNVALATTNWSSLVLEISGANASTAVVNCEWFMNVEFQLNVNDALTAITTPNPPKITAVEQSVSRIHQGLGSFIDGGVKQVESAVAKHASAAIDSFMADPLESIAGLFTML